MTHRPSSFVIVLAGLALALASCPDRALAANQVPTLLPGPHRLQAMLDANPVLKQRVLAMHPEMNYVGLLTAVTWIEARDAFTSGHLINAAHLGRLYAALMRGKPVEVDGLEGLPFGIGETAQYDLSTKTVFGDVTIGHATLEIKPSILEAGRLTHHVTAAIIVDQFQPGQHIQDIYADGDSLLVTHTDTVVKDGNGAVTDQYSDTFDHTAHTSTRTRTGQAAQTTTYPADAILSVHAWAIYYMRAMGVDVGKSYRFVLVDDTGPFNISVTGRTQDSGYWVLQAASDPDRIQVMFRDDPTKIPQKFVMHINAAPRAGGANPTGDQTVTLTLHDFHPVVP